MSKRVKKGWRCYRHKGRKGWEVHLRRGGKQIYIGFSTRLVDAIIVRNVQLERWWGPGGLQTEWERTRRGRRRTLAREIYDRRDTPNATPLEEFTETLVAQTDPTEGLIDRVFKES